MSLTALVNLVVYVYFGKKTVNVDVIYGENNVIHTYISIINTNLYFHYSFVYGNPKKQQRKFFWEKLRRPHPYNHRCWICTGA